MAISEESSESCQTYAAPFKSTPPFVARKAASDMDLSGSCFN